MRRITQKCARTMGPSPEGRERSTRVKEQTGSPNGDSSSEPLRLEIVMRHQSVQTEEATQKKKKRRPELMKVISLIITLLGFTQVYGEGYRALQSLPQKSDGTAVRHSRSQPFKDPLKGNMGTSQSQHTTSPNSSHTSTDLQSPIDLCSTDETRTKCLELNRKGDTKEERTKSRVDESPIITPLGLIQVHGEEYRAPQSLPQKSDGTAAVRHSRMQPFRDPFKGNMKALQHTTYPHLFAHID
uniref:Uncharacterized protein n=1 Tax=Steinernema glaseri TaxID=37863 RepID=A0A1I7Y1Y7_9BILA